MLWVLIPIVKVICFNHLRLFYSFSFRETISSKDKSLSKCSLNMCIIMQIWYSNYHLLSCGLIITTFLVLGQMPLISTHEIIKWINLERVTEWKGGWSLIKLREAVKIKPCQSEEELKYAEFLSTLCLILVQLIK